jgi:hypothetical protein
VGVQSTQRRWRKFETKISFRFSDLLLRSPPFGAALFSDDRVIGGTRFSVNDPNDKNDIFSSGDQLVPWKTRLKCQRFQASRTVSSIWDFFAAEQERQVLAAPLMRINRPIPITSAPRGATQRSFAAFFLDWQDGLI